MLQESCMQCNFHIAYNNTYTIYSVFRNTVHSILIDFTSSFPYSIGSRPKLDNDHDNEGNDHKNQNNGYK